MIRYVLIDPEFRNAVSTSNLLNNSSKGYIAVSPLTVTWLTES